MIRALIAPAFSALKSYVCFLPAPLAVVSVIGGEKETITVAKTETRVMPAAR